MTRKTTAWTLAFVMGATAALSHGDVAPQPVNTDALPDVGEEWLTETPSRDPGAELCQAALAIGASRYHQN